MHFVKFLLKWKFLLIGFWIRFQVTFLYFFLFPFYIIRHCITISFSSFNPPPLDYILPYLIWLCKLLF